MSILFEGMRPILVTSLAMSLPSTEVITAAGDSVTVVTIGHASLLLTYQGKHIYVDPWSHLGDYMALPKAAVVLVTHEHGDHLDAGAVAAVRALDTVVVANEAAAQQLQGAIALKNGDARDVTPYLRVAAVPAYNLPERAGFHPKGRDNGYVLTLGGTTFYVAGDTEPQPEILTLKADVIFLPENQPYTMTIEQAVETAKAIKPKIFYPYHYSDTDVNKLKTILATELPETEVRLPPQKKLSLG
jgi:L-ascorbate metabolism protein UlaG (beta-lactamase superfamily)